MFKKMGVFKSILVSYILITLIPIGAFLFYTINNIDATYRGSILENKSAELRRIQATLDLRLRECKNIAAQYTNSVNVSQYALKESTYTAYMAIKELENTKDTNEFLLDVGLYYFGDDVMYSASGATEFYRALKYNYNLSAVDVDRMATALRETHQSALISTRGGNAIFYLLPIPVTSRNATGMALFLFENSAIKDLFDDYENELQDTRLWLQDKGALLYSSNRRVPMSQDDLISLSRDDRAIIGDKQYAVLRTYSEYDEALLLISLVDENDLLPMMDRYGVIIVSVLIILLVIFTLSTWFAMRYWMPIRELSTLMLDDDGYDVHWEPIHTAVRNALVQNQTMRNALTEHQHVLRENFMLRMLYMKGSKSIPDEMKELGLDTQCSDVCVMTMLMAESRFISLVNDAIDTGYDKRCCAVEVGIPGCVVIALLSRKEEDAQAAMNGLIEELTGRMRKEGAEACSIGVGHTVPIQEMGWSYLQSMAVLDSSRQTGYSVEFISELKRGSLMHPELHEKEMILLLAIRQGNEQLARQMAREMIDYALNNAPSTYKYTCYCMINDIMKTYKESIDLVNSTQLEATWHRMANLIETSPGEFSEQLMSVLYDVCGAVTELSRKRDDQYVHMVVDFVAENCTNKDFSLDMLMEQFGFSANYWSRFFKDKLDKTFTDYVWDLRLKQARDLLKNTDIPVKDVVERVGYIDTRSFIRKFKNSEGVTPGQYRVIHASGLNDDTNTKGGVL